MNIGNQSTLNDLGDLKKDLEEKIAAAAAIKIGEVSQIENGDIKSGDLRDTRPTGVYRVQGNVEGLEYFGVIPQQGSVDGLGLMLQMQHPSTGDIATQIYTSFSTDVYVAVKMADNNYRSAKFLTSRNTITDANGFIKAA